MQLSETNASATSAPRTRRFACFTCRAAGALTLLYAVSGWSASDTWTNNATGFWASGGNWRSGTPPGATNGTASADVATFGYALTANRTVTVDANRNIGGILFTNDSAFYFTLYGGSLLLSNGGRIEMKAGAGAHNDNISSPITLQGDGGTATFANNSSGSGLVVINTTVTGVSTAGNTTTLTLNGINTGVNVNKIANVISDGANGGKLAVVKDDEGWWRLSGANTFSGGLTLNAGRLYVENSNGLGDSANPVTINGGSLNAYTTGNYTLAQPTTIGGDFALGASTSGILTLSGGMNLGGTIRKISVTNALGYAISGVVSNGGLTKLGAGYLALTGANTYTGDTTVSKGVLSLATRSLATNSAVSIASGATLNLAFAGTNEVRALLLNNVSQTNGVYTSANTGGSITGTGCLRIQQPVPASLYIEAESAQFAGNWLVTSSDDAAYGDYLLGDNTGGGNDATFVIPVALAANYNVWVRSRDFDTFVGQRRFKVGVDGVLFPFEAGAHGTNGWLWEYVGTTALTAQDHVVTLKDSSQFYPRCDALYLTTTAANPNQLTFAQLNASAVKPRTVAFRNLDSPSGVMLRFSTGAEATNNFRALTSGTAIAYTNAEGGLLRFTALTSNLLASAVFDSLPADGVTTNDRFCNFTASVDVRFGAAQQSFGIFSRIPGSEDNGHLILVNCKAVGTNDMFRFFGAGSNPKTSTVSSTVLAQDTTNLLSVGTWYTLRLTVKNTGDGGATFTLNTLNRTNGVLVATKTATAASGALTSPGELGLRFYSIPSGAGATIDVDNLSVFENEPDFYTNGTRTAVATLNGSGTRVTFYSQPDIDGAAQITREVAVLTGTNWVTLPLAAGAERLILQYRSAVTPNTAVGYAISWSQRVDFEVNGVAYASTGTTEDPSLAANPELLIPRACAQLDPQTVQVTCRSLQGRTAVATWQPGAGGSDVGLTVAYTADRTGDYAFGFGAFAPSAASPTNVYQLPPLYQFQRLPATPKLLTSSYTPQPLALIQRTFSGVSQPVTLGVVADPARFAFAWPNATNADYGFSLMNTDGTVQPGIFAPVLGLKNSLVSSGAVVTASWRVLARAGDWKSALEYASGQILGVTDYRQPYRSSLTHALLNMIDLIRDDNASGWGGERRASLQIESEDTASQPSPLTFLSLALLTRDESLYQSRSLPTIEFSLSRPRAHFATDVTPNTPSGYVTTNSTQITVPSTYDGTAYWQGVHDLLARRNPWVATLALTNGGVRYDTGNTYMPRWVESLGQYRLNPSSNLLQQIETDCQTWINSQFLTPKTSVISQGLFYHNGFYPFWWGLLDMYELTGKTNYLSIAEEGAFHTISGVFSFPLAPPGNVTVNAGGCYLPNWTLWWKGPERYRLGWPRTPGDTPERSVPAWLVSPVGYTLEQPVTYYATDGGFRMQMMAAWAPQLQRLYRHTGREIYQTYARNAMIGRFSNDPGYYLTGFTDMFHDPQYPYRGPDVSSFYYHHMPARIAFVIDFLMAQAETLSGGRIKFPWVKQQGYVWFTDRIFGGQPGAMYGETGLWPWFDRSAAQVDTENVDYLFARGTNSFWVALMNQSSAPVTVNLTTATAVLGINAGQPVNVFQNNAAQPDQSYSGTMAVTVPGRKLVALRFATQPRDVFPCVAPLDAAPTNQVLPGTWGTMHAFRIRSPFGSDSLYVVLTGRPANSPTARLLLDGAPVATDTAYPYEFSVYPWPMNQPMRFSLQLVDGGVTNTSAAISLAGTASTPPVTPVTTYQTWAAAITNGLTNATDCAAGDGVPNLLKYATGSSPTNRDLLANLGVWVSNGLFWVRFHRNTNASDVTLFVEAKTNLLEAVWSGIATNAHSGGWQPANLVDEAGLGVTNPVTTSVLDNSGSPQRFMRLRVTLP